MNLRASCSARPTARRARTSRIRLRRGAKRAVVSKTISVRRSRSALCRQPCSASKRLKEPPRSSAGRFVSPRVINPNAKGAPARREIAYSRRLRSSATIGTAALVIRGR
jgi:hypothetical protein